MSDPVINAPVWHGEKFALRSRHEHTTSDGIFEVSISYEGQMDKLRANSPGIGSGVAGYFNVFVEDITLESTGLADKGILNFTASDRLIRTVDEVEWLHVDQDIRNHRLFAAGGGWALTDQDRKDVENALNNPDVSHTISTNAYQLWVRLLRGETNYAIYIPVVRRSSWFLSFPFTTQCGLVSPPPMPVPPGYTYVLTADRANRRGFYWERTFEWTGFSSVDTPIINGA